MLWLNMTHKYQARHEITSWFQLKDPKHIGTFTTIYLFRPHVKYLNNKSSTKISRIGVPQGTIMGSLLWNVFVNDRKPNVSHIKYADNTMQWKQFFITNPVPQFATIELARNLLRERGNFASNWCNENAMLLNSAKSSVITFTLMKEIHSEQIVINNNQIS